MQQLPRKSNFTDEPLDIDLRCQCGVEHLQGNGAVVAAVMRTDQPDVAIPAHLVIVLDQVTISQIATEKIQQPLPLLQAAEPWGCYRR